MAPLWLKAVPWSTILANAPLIVDGAKKLAALVKDRRDVAPTESTDVASGNVPPETAVLLRQLRELEARQQEATALIADLAESQAQLTQAVERLRKVAAWGWRLAVVSLAGLIALGVWVAVRH